jgi:hypothetical protein
MVTDELTNKVTFAILELLSQLKTIKLKNAFVGILICRKSCKHLSSFTEPKIQILKCHKIKTVFLILPIYMSDYLRLENGSFEASIRLF